MSAVVKVFMPEASVEADSGEHRANKEQADGGKLEGLLDPVGAEAQAEHDGGGPEGRAPCPARGEQVAGDVLNPAVRAEFDSADEGVRHEEHEEQESNRSRTW
jgi:hypothetical protein